MACTRPILVWLILLLTSSPLIGQEGGEEETRPLSALRSDLQFGALYGGQVVNEEFIYKPGVMAMFSVNKAVGSRVDLGLGLGLIALEEETVLPIYVDLKAYFKPEKRSFIGMNIGASRAWSATYRNIDEFEYEGGFYFSPYYAVQFPISERVNLLFSTGLVHFVGEIEFLTEFEREYEERFAMDFLSIRTGIRF